MIERTAIPVESFRKWKADITRLRAYIDWPLMIEALEAKPEDRDLHERAVRSAGSWVTCACGNLCWRIPRDVEGAPIDEPLRRLGVEFVSQIRYRNYERARRVLGDIDLRSMEILHIMNG